MTEIKEINVFTFGDSSLVRTWSNVPFLLTKTLKDKGYVVNRINIMPNRYLQSFYNRIIYKITLLIKKDNVYLYERTFLNFILTFYQIRKFNKKYPNADLNIFTNFSFYNKYSTKPNVLFGDWDLDIGINERMGRKPYYFEQKAVDRQRKVIENSDLVISLFPKSAEIMRLKYNNANIFHLKQNVINSLYGSSLNRDEIIVAKKKSFDLLFIGSINYVEGAKLLINAYSKLKQVYPQLSVKIVGIRKEQIENLPEGVECYGYLDKNEEKDRKLYYELILKARIFVNPTPLWGGYSSTIEAMYFYTPIIVSPYEEFVEEFGEKINFGKYCEEFSVDFLSNAIIEIIDSPNYESISENAHQVVHNYTWDKYVDLMLGQIKKI